MEEPERIQPPLSKSLCRQVLLCAAAIVCFKAAFLFPAVSLPAMSAFGVFFCFATSTNLRSAFYSGLTAGTVLAGMELTFFRTVFGDGAIGLWLILGLWLALFSVSAAVVQRDFPSAGIWLLPVFWIGFEYFRSELYYLRFSWVTPGLSLVGGPWQQLLSAGQYGAGGLLILLSVTIIRRPVFGISILLALCGYGLLNTAPASSSGKPEDPLIAGIQLEHPEQDEVSGRLDEVLASVPEADLIMLSEYTFDGPVPQTVLDWCDRNNCYVVVGGKDMLKGGEFRNTVFVVGHSGVIEHSQAKSVPIQFFKDGLPAEKQEIWQSPWGRIGFAICYDMSYTRVTDRLVEKGAQAILNPTMDPVDWGVYEHRLHGRIPVMRSVEYALPIARLASSGVSPFTDAGGRTLAIGSFPGPGEIVSYRMPIAERGRIPFDRWLVMLCVIAIPGIMLIGIMKRRGRPTGQQ